jgi:hypothetical protein
LQCTNHHQPISPPPNPFPSQKSNSCCSPASGFAFHGKFIALSYCWSIRGPFGFGHFLIRKHSPPPHALLVEACYGMAAHSFTSLPTLSFR